jgi:DNA-binding SARP family transcriptional activator/transcriptional regulator with XRE-family HTH domain
MAPGDSDLTPQFGSLIRAYRHEMGLTQRELAARTGLSVAALRDFEQSRRRRPRPHTLAALADGLGLDAAAAVNLARAAALPRQRPGTVSSPRPPQGDSDLRRTVHSSGRGEGLWLAALGPLEAWGDGTPLYLGPPARRAVLGLLVMSPGVLVRRDTIVDLLWGDSPPRTAVGLVQAHVSRVRRLLESNNRFDGNDEGRVIDSVGGSYRLSLSDTRVDLLAFRDLATRAATARAGGDYVTAAECYERAVSLWRGDPLADVDILCGHPGVTALRQELVEVLLRYAEVACALGQHYRVLPRLQALADAEPLNERVHAYLMIALAGSGQQAVAIRVYEDVRSRLDRELGLYPGEELAGAYGRVLRQDIQGASRESLHVLPPVLATAVHVVPRQLPAAPRCFTGRASELARLSALGEQDGSQASGVVIAALTGMAGIGKTALAVHWAHQMADRFPDGQLFVNLCGSGPSGTPVAPTAAVGGVLTALGVPPARIPADIDGQVALYRSLLAGRRMLIVLDNAHNAEQARPLLPGSPECLVLVTSRNRLTGLAAEGVHLMTLGVLTEAESHDLLALYLGAGRTAADPMVISELINLCGRLPLALCDSAARAVARPGLPLAALVSELRDARRRLDALETGEPVTSVRMAFSWSRARLGDQASHMFRLLGVYPGPDITVPTAANLAGLSPRQAYLALAELCDEHLLTEHLPGRYTCHDLLRSYAAEEASIREDQAGLRDAMQRVLDYYLHASVAASVFLCPRQAEVTQTTPRPGVTLEEIGGPRQAADWFENERHVLFAMIRQAAEDGYAPYAWELPWAAGWYFRGEDYWRRLAVAQESALAVATRLGDLAGLVMTHQHLGWLRFMLGDIASVGHHFHEAVEMAGQLDDARLRALSGLSCAYVLQSPDITLEAMAQAKKSLRLYHSLGDLQGDIQDLYTIGGYLIQLGDHELAAHFSSRALVAYRQSCAANS